jgi:hypothetical protein
MSIQRLQGPAKLPFEKNVIKINVEIPFRLRV